MAVKCGGFFIVLVAAAFMFGIAMGNKDWNSSTFAANWNHTNSFNFWPGFWPQNATQRTNRFVVGGTENWRYGYNYTEWAIKTGPFYLNDTLVFKYDPPNGTTFPHNVYLLPNYRSFQNCDFTWARQVADVTKGGGEGFEFTLKRWQPYYFACGVNNGSHCSAGSMKFAVWPLIRWFN